MSTRTISTHLHLRDWYHISAAMHTRLAYDLSLRQWLILSHVYLVDDTHSVKSLSYTFDIGKPAVCRALDTLSDAGLLKRVRDEQDRRNVLIQKTLKGIGFLNQFSDILEEYYSKHSATDTENMYDEKQTIH